MEARMQFGREKTEKGRRKKELKYGRRKATKRKEFNKDKKR
jgi:hypothetical protein